MRRRLVWGLLTVLIVVVAGVLLLPRWLSSDLAREQLEAMLSDALGRTVTIESIEVHDDQATVDLRGVKIAQPDALVPEDGAPMLHAEQIQLEVALTELLERRVVGTARAEGLTLDIRKRDGITSLHGLGPERGAAPSDREPITLALGFALADTTLELQDLDRGERVSLRGVELRGDLNNSPALKSTTAFVKIAALEFRGVPLHDIQAAVQRSEQALVLSRLQAKIGEQGRLEGHGSLGLRPAAADDPDARDWSVELELADAALEGPLRDLIATAVPAVVRSSGSPGQPTTGRLGAVIDLQGTGLRWDRVAPSLKGTLRVQLSDVRVPPEALLARVAALAGRAEGAWSVAEVSAEVAVADGWLRPGPLVLGDLHPRVEGRVSLAGELELDVDLMPLVKAYGGGTYAAVARTTTTLPVRVTGTIKEPRLAPPRARDVASGLLGAAVRRTLESSQPDG